MSTRTTTSIDLDLFPTTERIHGWIRDLAALGHRRTGTPQGRRSAEYIERVLLEAGLEQVRIERAPTPCPVVHAQELRVGGAAIETFWANGTGRISELGRFTHTLPADTPVVYLGAGWEEEFEGVDVAGKIVVCDIEFLPMTTEAAVARNERTEVYDPDGSLQIPVHKYDIYSPNNWPYNYFRAQQGGAVGFVGSLRDYMDASYYNEDYTEIGAAMGEDAMSIPALWVSRGDGDKIVDVTAQAESPAIASLVLDVEYTLEDALNVRGVLPGQSSDIILVHSHHDAVFAGAVQDASGVSEVLALAEYFSQIPLEQRPKTMMFALTDTHFTDYVGHEAFIAARAEAQDRIILDVCIEHIGKEIVLGDNNEAVETGYCEPRMVYVSDESGLLGEVKDSFARHGLGRTFFAPVATAQSSDGPYQFRADEVVSDAYYFAEAGIPVVSLVAGQMYLFHPSDTIDRVLVEDLRPVGIAFAEIAVAAGQSL